MFDKFEQRETIVVAIAQEDKDLETHGRILKNFEQPMPFEVLADLEGTTVDLYDRTSTYLIDMDGVVREIFPALIHMRPSWHAVLHRIDAMDEAGE